MILSANLDWLHVFYTILIVFNNFVYGFSVTIIGVTLVDLGHIYDVEMNKILYISMVIYGGLIFGSLSGWFYQNGWLQRQLTLVVMLFLCAIVMGCIPFYRSIAFAFPMLALNGVGMGVWVTACNSWLVELWPKANAMVLQINYVMYGIGTILAPLISAPFVHGNSVVNNHNETLTIDMRIDDLTIPYGINGFLQAIVPLIFLILYFTKRYESKEKNQSTIDNKDDGNVIHWRRCKLAICGFSMAISVAAKIGYFTYSPAMFQYMEIHLTASDSAHVMSALSAAYTIGPLVTAFISIKLKPDYIISYHFAMILLSFILIFFGRDNIILIYLGSIGLGYGFSVLWPALFAFTELYLKMTDSISSIFSILFGIFNFIIPFILGETFNTNPLMLIYLESGLLLFSSLLFVTARIWIQLIP